MHVPFLLLPMQDTAVQNSSTQKWVGRLGVSDGTVRARIDQMVQKHKQLVERLSSEEVRMGTYLVLILKCRFLHSVDTCMFMRVCACVCWTDAESDPKRAQEADEDGI